MDFDFNTLVAKGHKYTKGKIVYNNMEKRIQVSTQGRLTIPKILRDSMRIVDGQPIIIRSDPSRRELVIELLPTIGDYSRS